MGVETLTQFYVVYILVSAAVNSFTVVVPFHLSGLLDSFYFYVLLAQGLAINVRGYILSTYTSALLQLMNHSSLFTLLAASVQYYFIFWYFYLFSLVASPLTF